MQACFVPVESSVGHVALRMTGAAHQPELSNRTSAVTRSSRLSNMEASTDVKFEESLRSSRQDLSLYETLPWREARCLEDGTAQPERNTLSAFDFTAVRANCSMELAVAKLQLERKLAEIAEHSISSEGLLVTSMPHEVGSDERLRGLVSEGKEMF